MHKKIDIIIEMQSETDLKINSINNQITNFKRKEALNEEEQLKRI